MKMKKKSILIVAAAILLLNCRTTIGSGPTQTDFPPVEEPASPAPSPTPPQPTPTYSLEAAGPMHFPPDVNPLTGLQVADPSLLERRPVAVKIINYPRTARPQWGLSLADIVYEYYHNNDLPRFHAIFYGNDVEMAGPIRSGRLFDDYLMQAYKSVMVFGSADSRILERLAGGDQQDRLIYLLSGVCPPQPVCRYNPGVENFLVTSTSAAGDYVESQGDSNQRQDLTGMFFSSIIPSGAQSANRFYLRYSYGAYLYWQFDPELGRYLRYQDTQEDIQGRGELYELLTDRVTGQPVMADNVVFLVVPHFHLVYVPGDFDTPTVEIVDMNFEGGGPAYALRDGLLYEVNWIRPTDGRVITLTNADGSPYAFKPGTTWFQVVSPQSRLETNADVWRMEFVLR
jgi:hypothetical protein